MQGCPDQHVSLPNVAPSCVGPANWTSPAISSFSSANQHTSAPVRFPLRELRTTDNQLSLPGTSDLVSCDHSNRTSILYPDPHKLQLRLQSWQTKQIPLQRALAPRARNLTAACADAVISRSMRSTAHHQSQTDTKELTLSSSLSPSTHLQHLPSLLSLSSHTPASQHTQPSATHHHHALSMSATPTASHTQTASQHPAYRPTA